jgi:hypothetical protein
MNLRPTGFFHSTGNLIQIPLNPNDIIPDHHGQFAAKNPHLFGFDEKHVKSAIGDKEYNNLISGKSAWSERMNRLLNNSGFMRYTKQSQTSFGQKHHDFTISTENRTATIHDFIEPLRTLKTHLEKINPEDTFHVTLSGFRDLEDRNKFFEDKKIKAPETDAVAIPSMKLLNKMIGEEGGKISRDPLPEPKSPSSEDIRRSIGPKPEGMSTAEFNFYRNIGDSVKTPINFNLLLERIKENKLLKRIAMRNYTSPIGLLTRDIPKTDEKTLKAMADIPATKRQKIITQAREKWESDRAASVKRNREIEKVTNLLVGEDDSNIDRYDKIMKLATNKKRANIADVKKYGYPLSKTSFASETMERIASTFERKRQKSLVPSGTGHY